MGDGKGLKAEKVRASGTPRALSKAPMEIRSLGCFRVVVFVFVFDGGVLFLVL